MSNIFAAADAASSAAVSFVYGEKLRFLPMQTGSYTVGSRADSSRSIRDFKGVLSGELGSQNLSGRDSAQSFGSNMNTRDRNVSAEAAPWLADVRPGDRIKALDQPGQPEFAITSPPVDDGSGNRYLIQLVTT